MIGVATQAGGVGMRRKVVLLVAAGVALFIAANAHLIYVATISQPDCVAHVRHGEGSPNNFSAAASSCSPKIAKPNKASAE